MPDIDVDTEEALMRELRDAVSLVPGQAAARRSAPGRAAETVLAEVDADSDPAPGAGPRALSFRAPGLLVELEVTPHDERRDVAGHLTPPVPGSVEVRWPGGGVRCTPDLSGYFSVADVPAGPVSLLCRLGGTAPVTTSWLSL
ncbi:hypothetical protein [Allonocardiopsis opalescens]|uniref:Uncharacterized protein n=1 Tax=Allonocardiopsis opalescens TaxID=1144618 RepID=A0A2T0PXD6_9ACTN|nr:hypothetical protein [Allonocardiopsis opalescens]PRX96195.1 hypothetical protein CLV72_108201 [Allonocardiopsis opalescens]